MVQEYELSSLEQCKIVNMYIIKKTFNLKNISVKKGNLILYLIIFIFVI